MAWPDQARVTYSTIMTTPPDPHDLARRFLDLWQDQVQAMATDPELGDAVRRWTVLWAGAMRHPGSASDEGGRTPSPSTPDGLQPGYAPDPRKVYDGAYERRRPGDGETRGRPTAGATPAAVVPDDGGGDVALILCELRRLEERISGLEAQLERSGKQPEGSAQRPGSVASPPKHQKRKRGQTKQQS